MIDFNSLNPFLDEIFEELEKLNIEIAKYKLDHLGYSVSSKSDYDLVKNGLLEIGMLVREPLVSNRRVGVFKLNDPLKYNNILIEAIELIEPKDGESKKEGFEHVEFTVTTSLEDFANKYPQIDWDKSNISRPDFPRLKLSLSNGLEVKFNTSPILES